MPAFQVSVVGRVQGVNYRQFTLNEAQALGVRGWVRNLPDGSVQALIQHDDETVLGALIDRLSAGPPLAHVEQVIPDSVPDDPLLDGFGVIQ
jgi:acylphosphatase